ncbi:hypothetical protein ACHHYP_07131 [Achlya hypogyna]|uniref:SAM domain-containing protein n=1 Tax=Achlya hypogyna TaxID=1202772 RepID=A0A1V9ZMQ6_ACHHY|nr:hypothetical protein ACHHYP_07131 [Achlya hypogyna]
MGAAASLQSLGANDVANEVARLGEAYLEYVPLFTRNGVDGGVLNSLSEQELDNLLVEMGVSSALHRKILLLHLSKLKSQPSDGAALDGIPFRRSAPTLAPAQVLCQLFSYQGIHLIDPDDMDSVVAKILPLMRPQDTMLPDNYDCFISYRVSSEKEVAEKLYLHLKAKGCSPFLDRMSLKNAEPWKDGFLRGLAHSRVFLALISEAGLEKARDRTFNHREDNLLLEYEVALDIAYAGRLVIFPIYVASSNNGIFTKFQGFSTELYASSLNEDDAHRRGSVPAASSSGHDVGKRRQSEQVPRSLPSIASEVEVNADADVNRKVSLSETMTTDFEEVVKTLGEGDAEAVSVALEKIFGIVQRSKYAVKFALANGWVALIQVLCNPRMDELQKDYAAGALSFIAPALSQQAEPLQDVWTSIEESLLAHHVELIENVLAHGSPMQKQYILIALMHLCERDHLRDVLRQSDDLQLTLEELQPLGSQVQAHACTTVLARCFPPVEAAEAAADAPPTPRPAEDTLG